jgi:methylphosphotriester-DNA--protein-cysteine methyltransferase
VGSRQERRYHELTSGQVRKIKRKNTVFFADEEAAARAGFVPSKI